MNNKLFTVEGHVVVVTGGTGVLGRAIAKHLQGEGAQVIAIGRNAEVGKAMAEECGCLFLQGDVLDRASMEACRPEILIR